MRFALFLLVCLLLNAPVRCHSREVIAGPVDARVLRVVDGDTVLVAAHPWPQHSIEVLVRLRGIDTPERHSRCAEERQAADAARADLARLLATDDTIRLTNIEGDKYFGRVVATVETSDGRNPAATLLARHLAVIYEGGRKPARFCIVHN